MAQLEPKNGVVGGTLPGGSPNPSPASGTTKPESGQDNGPASPGAGEKQSPEDDTLTEGLAALASGGLSLLQTVVLLIKLLLKGGWFKGGEDKPKDKAEGADAPGSDPKGQSEGQGGPKPNDARTQSPPDQKMGSYRDVLKTGVDLPNPDHETGGSPNTGKPKIPAPTSVAPLP